MKKLIIITGLIICSIGASNSQTYETRFAGYVLGLSPEQERNITVSVSKTTVAQKIGTTKETLSRLLARLARRRILTYRGHQLCILNRFRLEAIARGDERI